MDWISDILGSSVHCLHARLATSTAPKPLAIERCRCSGVTLAVRRCLDRSLARERLRVPERQSWQHALVGEQTGHGTIEQHAALRANKELAPRTRASAFAYDHVSRMRGK